MNRKKLRALVLSAFPTEYDADHGYITGVVKIEHPGGDVYEIGQFQSEKQIWESCIVEFGKGNPNAAQKTRKSG